MSQFDYLAVLISIVLGLGIANILSGFAAIVQARDRVKLYAPAFFHLANLFVIHVQVWWTMFALREVRSWTFTAFLTVLMQPVLIFLASAFLVPRVPDQGAVDLQAIYFRENRWFFGTLLLALFDSVLRNVAVAGHVQETADLIGHGVFLVLALIGLTRNGRVHQVLAPMISLALAIYVGVLFARLH